MLSPSADMLDLRGMGMEIEDRLETRSMIYQDPSVLSLELVRIP